MPSVINSNSLYVSVFLCVHLAQNYTQLCSVLSGAHSHTRICVSILYIQTSIFSCFPTNATYIGCVYTCCGTYARLSKFALYICLSLLLLYLILLQQACVIYQHAHIYTTHAYTCNTAAHSNVETCFLVAQKGLNESEKTHKLRRSNRQKQPSRRTNEQMNRCVRAQRTPTHTLVSFCF